MKDVKNELENVHLLNSQLAPDSSVRFVMLESDHADEISLLDLWLVIVKRRALLLLLMLLFLFLGVFYALYLPNAFNYSSAIEIGGVSYNKEGKLNYIEPPLSVLAKLNQSYIPLVVSDFLQAHPEIESVPDIKAKLEKNSNIIFLNLKGIEKDKAIYIDLLNAITEKVKLDHLRISSLKRKDLELSVNNIENQIIRLKSKEQLLHSQNKRLDRKELLLKQRITDTRYQLKMSEQMKANATRGVGTEGKALALMMVDNEMSSSRNLLADLEEQLQISLENSREVMLNNISANQQQQAEKGEQLERLKIQMTNLLETRAITQPMQSIKSVGMSSKLIVIISLLAGVFLGLFAVFFAEFLEKAKKYKADA